MDDFYFYSSVSDKTMKKERQKARDLRQSAWWKNQLGQGKCYYCSNRFHPSDLTMDHIVPVVRGGQSVKSNVVPSCKECNTSKGNMTEVEWRVYYGDADK